MDDTEDKEKCKFDKVWAVERRKREGKPSTEAGTGLHGCVLGVPRLRHTLMLDDTSRWQEPIGSMCSATPYAGSSGSSGNRISNRRRPFHDSRSRNSSDTIEKELLVLPILQ